MPIPEVRLPTSEVRMTISIGSDDDSRGSDADFRGSDDDFNRFGCQPQRFGCRIPGSILTREMSFNLIQPSSHRSLDGLMKPSMLSLSDSYNLWCSSQWVVLAWSKLCLSWLWQSSTYSERSWHIQEQVSSTISHQSSTSTSTLTSVIRLTSTSTSNRVTGMNKKKIKG